MDIFPQVIQAIDIAPLIIAVAGIIAVIGSAFTAVVTLLIWITRSSNTNSETKIGLLNFEISSLKNEMKKARDDFQKRADEDAEEIIDLKIRIDGFPLEINYLKEKVVALEGQIIVKDQLIAEKV